LEITKQKIAIEAADGRELSARWWQGTQAPERSVVFIPALAAPQEYLHFFASYLAQRGWGVLTFDYRSAGSSLNAESDSSATLDDWANLDLPAAVAEARRRANPKFLAAVAHSIGGQLLGQSPIRRDVNGALFIAAQRGIPKFYKGAARLRIEYAYGVFPTLIRLFGRLPVSSLTLPAACSGRAVSQWVRWGRSGVFTDSGGADVESRFDDYRGPLTAVTVDDDEHYAPVEAVEALTRMYRNAEIRREIIRPQDYGVEKIGHFGFFYRRAPRELWDQAETWLREMEKKAAGIIVKRPWGDEEYARWFESLETRSTPRNTPQDLYEIRHTGDYNYRIEGGGEKFWADGIEEKTVVLEAKRILTPERSPFIQISRIDVRFREIIIAKVKDEFRRLGVIMRDEGNPLTSVRVIVSDAQAKPFFESLLRDLHVPGEVVVKD
jgi:predicted alpha/beta hydrolase